MLKNTLIFIRCHQEMPICIPIDNIHNHINFPNYLIRCKYQQFHRNADMPNNYFDYITRLETCEKESVKLLVFTTNQIIGKIDVVMNVIVPVETFEQALNYLSK